MSEHHLSQRRSRGPFWLVLALPITAITVAVCLGDIEASGWARAGWTAALVVASAVLWLVWWFDRR